MSRQHAFQAATAPAEQSSRHRDLPHGRCYTAAQIIGFLQISRAAFFEMKRRGRLPFLEELKPAIGRCVRYRADLVDRYLAGQWQPLIVPRRSHGAKSRASHPRPVSPQLGQGVR